jgi:chromosome segregation ATPase
MDGAMAKSTTHKRNTNTPSPEAGEVREMRIDAAHRLGDAPATEPTVANEDFATPHTPWESALNAAESALVQAWDEHQGPAFETSSPVLEPTAGPKEADAGNSSQLGPTELQTWRTARTQLQQLAALLNQRQQELDQREASLHAQQATVEQLQRSVQLSLHEYHAHTQTRDASFDQREQTITERLEALAKLEWQHQQEVALHKQDREEQQTELKKREQRLREWEITLSQRTGHLELVEHQTEQAAAEHREQQSRLAIEAELLMRRADALRQVVQEYLSGKSPTALEVTSARALFGTDEPSWDNTSDWQVFIQHVSELAIRRERLAQAEASTARSQTELLEQRQDLSAAQRNWEQQKQAVERELERERTTLKQAQQQELQQQLATRQELSAKREAISQLQAELLETQRELLQDRLAYEELVSQQANIFSQSQQTAAQFRARQRLSDLYRLQIEQLTHERQQLAELLSLYPSQLTAIQQQREHLEEWLQHRQSEINGVMQQLAARECDLDQAAQELQLKLQTWSQERLDYEQQIRNLLTELGK